MKTYLLLPHLEIHNANAFSSIYTVGFPSMTAWLGFTHNLERRLNLGDIAEKIKCNKTAVIVHNYHMHSHYLKGNNYKSLAATANPLKKKGGNFERPPFIAEGRIDLNVSLLVEVSGVNGINSDVVINNINSFIYGMKAASGDLLSCDEVSVRYIDEGTREEQILLHDLMPGYVLIERRDLMQENISDGDNLDKLLDSLKVNFTAQYDGDKVSGWEAARKQPGWIVPIATGYRGIQPCCNVKNQRDLGCEHQFVEPVVTLGEFKAVYRMKFIDDIMWEYHVEKDLYVCVNNKL